MSNYRNACPPECFEDEDVDDYNEFSRPAGNSSQNRNQLHQNQNAGIKIIMPIGQEAGLNKKNFDIRLDTNAQQWFDKIHQYWRQCKCFDIKDFSQSVSYFISL